MAYPCSEGLRCLKGHALPLKPVRMMTTINLPWMVICRAPIFLYAFALTRSPLLVLNGAPYKALG